MVAIKKAVESLHGEAGVGKLRRIVVSEGIRWEMSGAIEINFRIRCKIGKDKKVLWSVP